MLVSSQGKDAEWEGGIVSNQGVNDILLPHMGGKARRRLDVRVACPTHGVSYVHCMHGFGEYVCDRCTIACSDWCYAVRQTEKAAETRAELLAVYGTSKEATK